MALIATATNTTRSFIIKRLGMHSPEVIYIPPIKNNIIHEVLEKPKHVGGYFKGIVDNLKTKRTNSGRKIVFCKKYRDVITFYQYFKRELQELFTEPHGSVNCVINRVVDVCTHCTHETVKNKIITQFMKESPLRIVIATIALGINCPDVRHWLRSIL